MTAVPPLDSNALKRDAAARALTFVHDGMKLGLGTGSTAEIFLDLLAAKMKSAGLGIVGTPTSERTAAKARGLGIPIGDLDSLGELDLCIDGADEADRELNLIKGGGGALLREKIVAASAKRMIVIVDESKLVAHLGAFDLPVEVVTLGHGTTAHRIQAVSRSLGYGAIHPRLRTKDEKPFRTDNGNYIYDCPFQLIKDVPTLAVALSTVPGVVDHGLFVGLASVLIVAGQAGVKVLERR